MLNEYGKSLLKPWCSVQNVVLALFLLYVVCLIGRQYKFSPSDTAAWIQAVGSIAAIWFATMLGRKQQAEDRRRYEETFKAIFCFHTVQHDEVDDGKFVQKIELRNFGAEATSVVCRFVPEFCSTDEISVGILVRGEHRKVIEFSYSTIDVGSRSQIEICYIDRRGELRKDLFFTHVWDQTKKIHMDPLAVATRRPDLS